MVLPERLDALHKKGRMKIKMAVVKERAYWSIFDKTDTRLQYVVWKETNVSSRILTP
jgi:hypothetical protein